MLSETYKVPWGSDLRGTTKYFRPSGGLTVTQPDRYRIGGGVELVMFQREK